MSSVVPGVIACTSRNEISQPCNPYWGNVVLAMHMDNTLVDGQYNITGGYGTSGIHTLESARESVTNYIRTQNGCSPGADWSYCPTMSGSSQLITQLNGYGPGTISYGGYGGGTPVIYYNNDIVFIDEKGHAVTANGNAKISTTQSKFGGASCYLDGSGDYLTVPHYSEFQVGYSNFTISGWFYVTASSASEKVIFSTNNANYWYGIIYVEIDTFGRLVGLCNDSGGATTVAIYGSTVNLNQWYYFAFLRSGSTYYLYENGVLKGASTPSSIYHYDQGLCIGAHNSSTGFFPGYIDDLQFTVGSADSSLPTTAFIETDVCYIPIPIPPAFIPTIKEVVTETPPEFVPDPTPVALTGAGGRMLVNIGSYSYQVRRDASFYDSLVKFNSSTYEVTNVVQNFGACDPVYSLSGKFLGCSNTDNSIHSICTDGTYIYVSAHNGFYKYNTSLVSVISITTEHTYDQLCYASSYLWAVSGVNVYKLDPTTLLEIENFTIVSIWSGDLILNTDGTDLFILRSLTSYSNNELLKFVVSTGVYFSMGISLVRGTPIVIGDYVYIGSEKIHKNTFISTELSFDLATSPYETYHSHWSVSGTLIAVLEYDDPDTRKQKILIVDTNDDSIVSTISNFQEVVTCNGKLRYAEALGVGLISDTKLIISNGAVTCYNYYGGLGQSGYSIYELQ